MNTDASVGVTLSRRQIAAFIGSLALLTMFVGISLWTKPGPTKFDPNYKLERVSNREFVNERVPLDGFEYVGCTFRKVTFVYNGTAPIGFNGNKFEPGYQFYTESDSV